MVTENEFHEFLLKFKSVGLKLHQNALEKFCMIWITYSIVLKCYICCCEMLCSRSGQDSSERDGESSSSSSTPSWSNPDSESAEHCPRKIKLFLLPTLRHQSLPAVKDGHCSQAFRVLSPRFITARFTIRATRCAS